MTLNCALKHDFHETPAEHNKKLIAVCTKYKKGRETIQMMDKQNINGLLIYYNT